MAGAIIIGVGPGIGLSVARRFAREGMPVSVLALSRGTVDAAADALRADSKDVTGLVADVADEAALRAALDAAAGRNGAPDVLVYNAGVVRRDRLGDLSAAELLATWAVNVGGAVTTAAYAGPRMAAQGQGFMAFTGGVERPDPERISLSLGKFGLRTLVDILDQQFGPAGVHVANVIVGGNVERGGMFDPDEIAETYWQLYREPPGTWTREVLYTGGADGVVRSVRSVSSPEAPSEGGSSPS